MISKKFENDWYLKDLPVRSNRLSGFFQNYGREHWCVMGRFHRLYGFNGNNWIVNHKLLWYFKND